MMASSVDTTTGQYYCIVARRAAISTRVTNARWSNIATQHAKRSIDQSIRKHVRKELPNYIMKNYLKTIRLMKKIVQFAFSHCHWIQAKQPSNHVVVNSSARVVFMRCRKHVGEGK